MTTKGKDGVATKGKEWSLCQPNLDGLWSTALLKEEGAFAWAQGALALLALTCSWSLGTFLPILAAYLLYVGERSCLIAGTCLLIVLGRSRLHRCALALFCSLLPRCPAVFLS